MEPAPLSHGRESVTFACPPRPGDDVPLVREEARGDWRIESDLEWLAVARTLPAPFQQVLAVASTADGVDVTLERFLGVDGLAVLSVLEQTGRLLPLDVWLGLTVRWAEALRAIPPGSDGWGTPVDPMSLGADVRGRLVCTLDEPNHVLGRWMRLQPPWNVGVLRRFPQSLSPEHVKASDLDQSARVFSFAAALCMLLQGARFYPADRPVIALVADLMLKELPFSLERHPDCPPAVEAVLRRAVQLDPKARFDDFGPFLAALEEAAGVPPAPEHRVAGVLLGVGAGAARQCLARLAQDPSALPASWAEGGLAVLEDRLLEHLVPLEHLPCARSHAAAQAPSPEKVNLAPAQKKGWRRFWPF